jgi:hypothetical protein
MKKVRNATFKKAKKRLQKFASLLRMAIYMVRKHADENTIYNNVIDGHFAHLKNKLPNTMVCPSSERLSF